MDERSEPRLGALTPLFIVRSLADALAWYGSLGFETKLAQPPDEPFFAAVRRDEARLFLKEIAPGVEPAPNRRQHEWARWDAFVHCEDPEALLEEWGGVVSTVEPLALGDDGLFGFAVADADGYVLFFGRPARGGDEG